MGPEDFKNEANLYDDFFNSVVKVVIDKYNSDLETMAEKMITDPEQRGIFVMKYSDTTWKMELTDEVPYGHLVEQTVHYPQYPNAGD